MNTEQKTSIDLRPRGEFIITQENGSRHEGRFCTWSLKRYCDKRELPTLQALINSLTTGLSIPNIEAFILSALEYPYQKRGEITRFQLTEMEIDDLIDDMGGLQSEMVTDLIMHAMGKAEKADDKKKAAQIPLGESSLSGALEPA